MKFLFIVQGEGRGHFTQAITLEEMLLRNGQPLLQLYLCTCGRVYLYK